MPRFEMYLFMALEDEDDDVRTEEYEMVCFVNNLFLFQLPLPMSSLPNQNKVQVRNKGGGLMQPSRNQCINDT